MRKSFSVYGKCGGSSKPRVSGCCLSEAQPRQASGWSDGGDQMKGEWAWEWAACVPSGWRGQGDPCGSCGWWDWVQLQRERPCPACIWRARQSCPLPACSSWTCWTFCGCASGCLLSSWSRVCWPVEISTLAQRLLDKSYSDSVNTALWFYELVVLLIPICSLAHNWKCQQKCFTANYGFCHVRPLAYYESQQCWKNVDNEHLFCICASAGLSGAPFFLSFCLDQTEPSWSIWIHEDEERLSLKGAASDKSSST